MFHRQVRVGLNGSPFTVYKFRSMYADAEARTGTVGPLRTIPASRRWGSGYAVSDSTNAQLFNVLRNDMALVGPRPERPEFVRTLNEQIPITTTGIA